MLVWLPGHREGCIRPTNSTENCVQTFGSIVLIIRPLIAFVWGTHCHELLTCCAGWAVSVHWMRKMLMLKCSNNVEEKILPFHHYPFRLQSPETRRTTLVSSKRDFNHKLLSIFGGAGRPKCRHLHFAPEQTEAQTGMTSPRSPSSI